MRARFHYNQDNQNQRGDTIVEVIIAIAVISSVLAGAFYLTNHSTRAVRDSEEHAQALQLLQGQVEQLRAQAPKSTWGDLKNPFCFSSSGTITPVGSGYGCTDSYYSFRIEPPAGAPAAGENGLFTLKVQWDSVLSKTGNETLLYKIPIGS
ncbi:MAG TPA: type II secretion system protein [Candidatus Saccharimonadales bacterium]|nr:type II secretion system protein [Candidatus Saccharimonadales bacterium]